MLRILLDNAGKNKMKFLTKTEINELNYAECQQQLKMLTTQYNLERPLTECWTEVWPVLDELTDMLLYLEDRVARYENANIKSMVMNG